VAENILPRALLVALLLTSAAHAATPGKALPLDSPTISARVAKMKPGDFLWVPEVSPAGPLLLIVSIKKQRAYLYRNGVPIGISTASTGKAGYETPTGVFSILQKRVDHKSNIYDNAPMPYMQRLTWSGIALHAGNVPGYPASHGCIRLPLQFAELLYGVSRMGMTVVVTEEAAVPRIAPGPSFLTAGPDAVVNRLADETEWQPEKAPSGPVSIVVSTADKRLILLRNGTPIGSSPISMPGELVAPVAFTLGSVDANGFQWMALPLPGQGKEAAAFSADQSLMRLPDAFRANLLSVLTPGATLIITPDTLHAGSAGASMTVIDSGDTRP